MNNGYKRIENMDKIQYHITTNTAYSFSFY